MFSLGIGQLWSVNPNAEHHTSGGDPYLDHPRYMSSCHIWTYILGGTVAPSPSSARCDGRTNRASPTRATDGETPRTALHRAPARVLRLPSASC